MTLWLILVFAVSALAYLILLIVKALLAFRLIGRQGGYLREKQAERVAVGSDPLAKLSSVTIMQPILSGDPLLAQQLLTNREGLPDSVRIVWLVDSSDAEGRRITAQLAATCPNVAVQFCPDAASNTNPKSFKLQLALAQITTEYLAVLDDDTTLPASSLIAALDLLEEHELYTGLPQYRADSGAASRLLSHFVNNNAVLTYLPLLNFAPPVTINGMFYVMRTAAWRQLGGFAAIMHELCDDFAVHRHAVSHGWRVVQGIAPQQIQTSVIGLRHYASLMHRWMLFATLLLRDQPWWVRLALVVLLGLPPLLLWLAIVASFGYAALYYTALGETSLGYTVSGVPLHGPAAVSPALAALVLASLLALRHGILVAVHRLAFVADSKFHAGYSLLAELLQPFHVLHALCVRTIRWRSRLIRVAANNRFQVQREPAS